MRKKRRWPSMLLGGLLCAASASLVGQAATLINSSCNVTLQYAGTTSQVTDTNPFGGCGVTGPGIGSVFSAQVGLTGSETATTSSFSGSVSAFGGPMGVFSGTAGAQAQGSNSMVLATAGSVRPGYLTVTVQLTPVFSQGDSVGFSSSFNIGSFSATCGGSLSNPYCGNVYSLPIDGSYSFTSPFTLGESFVFDQTFDLSAFDASADSPGSLAAMQVSYSLTDANGNPVNIYVTPEPAAGAMGGMGFCILLAIAVCVRKHGKRTGTLPLDGIHS